MFLGLLAMAKAVCHVTQTPGTNQTRIEIVAEGLPDHCRNVRLWAPVPLAVSGEWSSVEGRHSRIPADHIGVVQGGSWEIIVPELQDKGTLQLDIRSPANHLEGLLVAVGMEIPPQESAVLRHDQRWTLHTDPKHPGWSFADPKRGWTEVQENWELLPGAISEALPIPPEATAITVQGGRVEAGRVWSEGDRVQVQYRIAGTPAQGRLQPGVGSVELIGAGVVWVLDQASTAQAKPIEGGLHIDTLAGQKVSFRVASVAGAAVIPDIQTFIAGMTERFRVNSLPEPAVPTWLRAEEEMGVIRDTLYELVRDMPDLLLPNQDILHPRSLNRVWHQGWASPLEKALILHRMLGQERIDAHWALTGPEVDMDTLTGFTTAILFTEEGMLDPSCGVCGPGQVSTALMRQPLLDMTGVWQTPFYQNGHLHEEITLHDSTFVVKLAATGQATVAFREVVEGVDAAQQAARLLRALGATDGNIVSMTGLDQIGEPIQIELTTSTALHIEGVMQP